MILGLLVDEWLKNIYSIYFSSVLDAYQQEGKLTTSYSATAQVEVNCCFYVLLSLTVLLNNTSHTISFWDEYMHYI
jgi:hypothetical protein